MHRRELLKPDGRTLVLYDDQPFGDPPEAPQPEGDVGRANPELRWHPLRAEWVAYAGHRQERTFLPPSAYDPLAPSPSEGKPTEVPAAPWKVAVFENRFPSLTLAATPPPPNIVDALPGHGVCEVVVYTRAPEGGLGDLPLAHLELLLQVWADRTLELGSRDGIRYVMPFENRGVEVGATLKHPHGQIYAYPFVPPLAAIALEQQRRSLERGGRGLLERHIEREIEDGRRMLYTGDEVAGFIPAFARYPYEVWIAPRRACASLPALHDSTRADLARALKTVLLKYDALWDRPFPYVMLIHQAPTDGAPHPEAHLRFEFYPPYRTREKLKFLAGTEIGAGMFTNDALPEAKARELQAVEVVIEGAAR